MDVFEALRTRRSVRSFKEDKIEEDKLNKVLEAGRLAPSANNRQQWRFVVVEDASLRDKLKEAVKQDFVSAAPVVIAACAVGVEHVMSCGEKSYSIDVAAAIDHMIIQAAELGLGSCWIGAFYQDKVKEILDIPDDVRVVSLLPLGYPREPLRLEEKDRKPLGEIVCRDGWKF